MLSELKVLAAEFASLPDSFSRYAYLVELAALLPEADEELRQAGHLYSGCQSSVWLLPEVKRGKVVLRADSDTLILRGILYLFSVLLEGETPEAVRSARFDLLAELGIGEHFNSQRTLGIGGMLQEIQRRLSP